MLIITAPGQGAQTPGFLAPWLEVPGVAASPVTERTTSGPVTKMRPWPDRITTSVSAGP